MSSDWRRLKRRLEQLGYSVTMRKGDAHWKIRNHAGHLLGVASASPSDVRQLRNLEHDLRKNGVPL